MKVHRVVPSKLSDFLPYGLGGTSEKSDQPNVVSPAPDSGAGLRLRRGDILVRSSAEPAYLTFEKSAGMRTSLPSCRLMTNTDAAFGSKLS